MITYTIPELELGQYSLNKYYSGMNIHQRRKHTQYWHDLSHCAMRAAGIKRSPQDGPWAVTFYFNSRLDIDNHAVIAKMVIDSMKGWVFPNDTRQFLKEVNFRFWDGKGVKVEIRDLKGATP